MLEMRIMNKEILTLVRGSGGGSLCEIQRRSGGGGVGVGLLEVLGGEEDLGVQVQGGVQGREAV